MMYSLLYLVLAALGLGILVFIHELGHYFMAKREKMIVEAFSIGFGKAIKSWEKDGVKWQIGWVPFGGYVKIAGMEKKGNLEPYQIEGGFYSKTPAARIRVALAGPIANIILAFILFCCIWFFGGREKPFSDYTKHIGWVDTQSEVYKAGIKPGDEIFCYGGRPFQGFTALLSSAFLDSGVQKISGYTIDYFQNTQVPFSYTFNFSEELKGLDKYGALVSVINPASYLLYRPDNLMFSSPVKEGGIVEGDRVLWVDGELTFSRRSLTDLINEPKVLLTIEREGKRFFAKVPRLQVQDLRMAKGEKEELQDWAHASGIEGCFTDHYFIPYTVNYQAEIELATAYIDANAKEQKKFLGGPNPLEVPLQAHDRIVAVDGKPVYSGRDVFVALQKRHIQMIVQRGGSYPAINWKQADDAFTQGISFADLEKLILAVQDVSDLYNVGNLYRLQPIEPRPLSSLPLTSSIQTKRENALSEQRKQIEEIKNPKEKAAALRVFEQDQKRLFIGGIFEDRKVLYNPSPVTLFVGVFEETWKTLRALFTGYLSPKYMAGPIGIVGAMQYGWALGTKEALFWVAVISVNLGLINLLPIPVLDGGHVCFALYEAITRKRIKSKTMEKMIFPFVILMILFFIYLTYQDIVRIISRFF